MIFPAKLKSMRTTTAYRALLGVGLAGVLGLGLVNLAGAQGNVCDPTRSSCVPGSYYNSQSSHPGLIGANWRMSYETVLYDFGGEIQILQADGRRLMFQRGIVQNAALCSSPQPLDGQVRIEPPRDGRGPSTYHWRWADGRTLSFSGGSGGGFPLQAITAATGERVTLAYSPRGELTSIRDPQGRKLVFIYASAAEAAAQKRSRALKCHRHAPRAPDLQPRHPRAAQRSRPGALPYKEKLPAGGCRRAVR